MNTLTLRQTFALVALFVVTSATFISLDNRAALTPLKTGLYDIVDPITRGFARVARGPGNDSALEERLALVEAERDHLYAETIRMKDTVSEVEQLRAQLKVQEEHPDWTQLPARVVNPDPTNQQKTIVIDKGTADGVQIGMAVVDPNYYVGQITAVEEHSARVTLGIDKTASVGARLESGGDGVAYGVWQDGGRMELRHVDRDLTPKEGEYVVTADGDTQTSRVPPDIPIGRITGEPKRDIQSDTLVLEVLPYTNFEDLKVVTVILADAS